MVFFAKLRTIFDVLLFAKRQSDYENDARHFSRLMDVDAAHINFSCYQRSTLLILYV